MTNKIIVAIGIGIVAIGTLLSLWTILSTSKKYVGTAQWYRKQQEDFAKEKNKVIFGTILIILGSCIQIVGTLL